MTLQGRHILCQCLFFQREQQLSTLDLPVTMSHGESEIELYNYEGLYGHLTVYGFLYYDKAYC